MSLFYSHLKVLRKQDSLPGALSSPYCCRLSCAGVAYAHAQVERACYQTGDKGEASCEKGRWIGVLLLLWR
jgi:hypothetical protein